MTNTGPAFTTRKPRFNHVAMSLTPEMLDEEHRKLRADFFGDVFGFVDIPMMTIDRKRQVFQVHNIEQFVFLIADDDGSAMECPRLDHFGLSVGAESELDEILARAKAWQARRSGRHHRQAGRRSRHARDHEHLRALSAADDVRDPMVGLSRAPSRVNPEDTE